MNIKHSALLLLLVLPFQAAPVPAQEGPRISPASLPLPLPGANPMPPDRLRAQNPWNLPMTGMWRFKLTHGQILANHFAPSLAYAQGITASSHETKNPPINAFDGLANTRWCANNATFPQWLASDMGAIRHVTGVTLSWEKPTEQYQCRIEGGADGKHWKTLADHSAAPGIGSGPIAFTPANVRFLRVLVLGSGAGDWASLWECQIHYTQGGQDVVWKPHANLALPANTDDFVRPAYNDQLWDPLAVPSNWELAGYSLPTYDAVDDTVGLYRRWVVVPAAFAGHRVYWHFDGALDGAEVWVNGQRAGYHESGYTGWNIDLTGLMRPGQRNLFAVRVCKQTPSVDCETGDFQCMGGIYRDTSLIAVPLTHIHDITVRTPLAPNYRDATLSAIVQVMGHPGEAVHLAGSLVGADGQKTLVRLAGQGQVGTDGTVIIPMSAPVTAPKLWSAEKPNLYYLVLQLSRAGQPVERVEQRFGFRQIDIKNNIVLWNGQPIKCTGTCRHDFWADKGFALTDAEWNKDLTMMKAANINAIRTSHYNHAARFLELCDEKGFYILDEVPFCWINDQVKDPAYTPYLLQRAQETVARDKNRPCVLAWSLGNENPWGPDEQQVMDLVKQTDPTRPAFVSGMNPGNIKGQDWADGHYPQPGAVDRVVTSNANKWPTDYTEHPHTFYEKEAQDYDPGVSDLWSEVMIKTWDKLWKAPTILGSFIWEWQNQGIADKNADRTTDFWYGKDHLRQENNKGIVTAYRVPKAELWIVKMIYSPIVVGERTVSPAGGTCTVPLTNHYSFTDMKELTCQWTALRGDTTLRSGVGHIACAPMQSISATFPAPAGMTALRLEFNKADGSNVTVSQLAVEGVPSPLPPTALAGGGPLMVQDGADARMVSNNLQEIVWDKATGNIRHWRVRGRDLITGGPILNLGEGKAGADGGYYHAAQPPITEGAAMTMHVLPDGTQEVTFISNVLASAGGQPLGTLTLSYHIQPNAELIVHWNLDWTAADRHLWEVGLKLPVPLAFSRMNWWRDSYFTAYPAGHLGEPTGTVLAGQTLFRASKRNLHWLTLTDATGSGLELLQNDTPLVARANPGLTGNMLFASREVAGVQGLSGSWVSDHQIIASKGKPLSGSFVLRGTVGSSGAKLTRG